jgi:hypothetical protein
MDLSEKFGFGGKEPTPARPEALKLADAIFDLFQAKVSLDKAKAAVPGYTGQWDSKDYYAEEQETYNRAADAMADAMADLTTK